MYDGYDTHIKVHFSLYRTTLWKHIHSPIPSPSSHHTKRVDAVRYFYLYLYGGVYIDLDVMCIRPFEALSLQGGDAHFSFTNAGIYAHPVKCCRDDRTLCLNGTCVHQLRP